MSTDHVRIFDTTLRDGEQSPGCSMTTPQKLVLAQQLADLGVDIIEAGFAAASPDDFNAVTAIAGVVRGSTVAALARCQKHDIERAAAAVEKAERPRIHAFIATSDLHLEHKLRMSREQVLESIATHVALARSLCEDVEFSAEDGSRSDREFLVQALEAAIAAGATTLNIPDTVGYAVPAEYGALFAYLRENVRGVGNIILSSHCHNDLGLAVANSLAAIENGARQVECTINGIGERAGNAALEEIVMALRTRRAFYGVETRIQTRRLYPLSRQLVALTGAQVARNKAIVGENAFAHEAGIHQDGYLKNKSTYEIIDPLSVGVPEGRLVLGKHSGRHALKSKCQHLGHDLSKDELDAVYSGFIAIADRKKGVTDQEILALITAMKAGENTIKRDAAIAGD